SVGRRTPARGPLSVTSAGHGPDKQEPGRLCSFPREAAGAGGGTAISPVGANHSARLPPVPAGHTDRVFGPPDAPRRPALKDGLDDLSGQHSAFRVRTVHLELPTAHRGIHRRGLLAVEEL